MNETQDDQGRPVAYFEKTTVLNVVEKDGVRYFELRDRFFPIFSYADVCRVGDLRQDAHEMVVCRDRKFVDEGIVRYRLFEVEAIGFSGLEKFGGGANFTDLEARNFEVGDRITLHGANPSHLHENICRREGVGVGARAA